PRQNTPPARFCFTTIPSMRTAPSLRRRASTCSTSRRAIPRRRHAGSTARRYMWPRHPSQPPMRLPTRRPRLHARTNRFRSRRSRRVREGEEEIPGIGTLTLAAVVRARGHRVHIVDGKRTGTPVEQVARQVAALAPDHVGISATTISIHNAARIAARVKGLVPGVAVTVGGPHVSAVPEQTLTMFPGFDYGVVGEGERSYPELIAGDEPRAVAGLVWRDGERVRANPRAEYLDGEELDRLPEPAWDLVPDFPLRFQPNVFNY